EEEANVWRTCVPTRWKIGAISSFTRRPVRLDTSSQSQMIAFQSGLAALSGQSTAGGRQQPLSTQLLPVLIVPYSVCQLRCGVTTASGELHLGEGVSGTAFHLLPTRASQTSSCASSLHHSAASEDEARQGAHQRHRLPLPMPVLFSQ